MNMQIVLEVLSSAIAEFILVTLSAVNYFENNIKHTLICLI